MPTVIILSTVGPGSFTRPADWNDAANTIHVFAGGGGGSSSVFGAGGHTAYGGGGGEWRSASNVTLASVTSFYVGGGGGGGYNGASGGDGGDTWFDGSSLGTATLGAAHGGGGTVSSVGPGGSGGPGGVGNGGGDGGYWALGGGGGGGAGGPNGVGGKGAQGYTGQQTGGGGGGGGGGSAGSGTSGGAGVSGSGDGGNGYGLGNPGPWPGGAGTEIAGVAGAGGGGGGSDFAGNGFSGGLFGGGGGAGNNYYTAGTNTGGPGVQGGIIIVYDAIGNTFAPPAGTIVITGFAPVFNPGAVYKPGVGEIVITGFAPTFTDIGNIFTVPAGNIIIGGFKPTMTNRPTVDYWPTVISQYANSPVILQMVQNFANWTAPGAVLNDFYTLVWNIDTAVGYGLDVWGRIVGVGRVLKISGDQTYFGFEESTTEVGFNQAPFYLSGPVTSNYSLSDPAYRQLILAKALANICNGSIPAINQVLINLFGASGNAYVTDNQDMTMTYTFEFTLDPVQSAIVYNSGVLPRPAGVLVTVVESGGDVLLEDGSGGILLEDGSGLVILE